MSERRQQLQNGSMVIAAGLAGVLHGSAFGAAGAAARQLASLATFALILVFLKSRRRWGVLFLATASFWLVSYGAGLRWVFAALAAPKVLGFALGLMVYGILAAALSFLAIGLLWLTIRFCAPLRNPWLCAALFSTALTCAEFLREAFLPSFPWLAVGYAHVDSPFAALLPIGGVYGTGWVVQFLIFAASLLLGPRLFDTQAPPAATAVDMVIAAAVLFAVLAVVTTAQSVAAYTRGAGSITVAILQTALPTSVKFKASLLGQHIAAIGKFAQQTDAQLLLTPETAVPTTLRALTAAQLQYLELSIAPEKSLLFGTFAEDSSGEVFNSAVLLQHSAERSAGSTGSLIDRSLYIKQHLAPVGEYIPIGFGWIADLLGLQTSNTAASRDPPHNFKLRGVTIIPSVCQDLLYGADLRTTTTAPRLVVNLSNLEFFDDALARAQFLNIARVRALEQQVPVLLAANGGPSAIIGADGRIEQQLRFSSPGVIEASVIPRSGVTPFARFGNAGLYVVEALTGILGLWAWAAASRRMLQKNLLPVRSRGDEPCLGR